MLLQTGRRCFQNGRSSGEMAQGSRLFESKSALGRNHTGREKSSHENWTTNQSQYHAEHAAVRLAIGCDELMNG